MGHLTKAILKHRADSARYYAAHKAERQVYQLAYAKSHRKENNERERARRETHPIIHARRKKESYQRNREKVLATNRLYNLKHREEKAEASREWRRLHPRKAKALSMRSKHVYRARLAKAKGFFTYREFRNLCKKYGYRCLSCGKTEQQLFDINRVLVPDHVKPISRGGSNSIDNIQPLCHSIKNGRNGCNNSKHASEIDYRLNAQLT